VDLTPKVRHFPLVAAPGIRDAVSMTSQALSSRADLEFAESALRDVLVGEFKEEAMPDARSLGRMLVHLVNMHEAICTSSESHANVAKRLGDFALTTTRMANRNPQAATKLKRLSQVLDTASSRLGASTAADAGTIPT